jgi:hypothetical protein
VGAGRQARGLESCRGACRYPRGWAGRRRNVPTQGLLAGLRQVRSGSHKGVPARGAGAEFKRDGPAAAPIQTRRGGRLTNPVELLRASLPQHDLHQRRQVLEQVVVDAPPELGGLGLGRLGLAVAWGAAGRGRGGWGRGRAGRVGRRRRGPNAAAGGRVTPGGRGADRGDSVTDRRRRRGRGGGGRRRARRARARRAAGAARPRAAPSRPHLPRAVTPPAARPRARRSPGWLPRPPRPPRPRRRIRSHPKPLRRVARGGSPRRSTRHTSYPCRARCSKSECCGVMSQVACAPEARPGTSSTGWPRLVGAAWKRPRTMSRRTPSGAVAQYSIRSTAASASV